MLTAVVRSFYNQHMRAATVHPRQLRIATPFVKSSSRHLYVFSLPALQICRKFYINNLEIISLSFLKPLHKIAFCYNASIVCDGNQAPVRHGPAGQGDAWHGDTAPCTWDGSHSSLLSLDGEQSGWPGWKGRCLDQGCDTLSPNFPSVPLLWSINVLVPSSVFLLELRCLGWSFHFRVLYAWYSSVL